MKKLAVFLADYKKETVLAPAFKLLEAGMDLLVPLIVAGIINRGIGAGDKGAILRYFLFLILLAALGLGFSFTSQWFSAKASVGAATKLRQALFDHIQDLSYSRLDTLGTDTLITRMTSDVNQVQTGINMTLRLLLRSPFIVFGAMIMAFTIDVKCALVFAVAIPILSVVVFGIMLISIPLFRKVQAALDRVLSVTRENLTGVRVVRAFCKEEDSVKEFDEENDRLTKMNEFVGKISALMNPLTFLLINGATIVLIHVGAIQVNLGNLQQGDVVALYNYMAQIIVELIKLASLIITINKSMACADRIARVLDVDSGMEFVQETAGKKEKNETNEDLALIFDRVSFAYENAKETAIEGISFEVKRGQTVGIIGGTGSGKSTLVNLIPRFYDATEGRVLVNGRDVKEYPGEELIRMMGIVPQKAVLFKGTIRDNLRWGKEDASDEEIWKALEIAQAREVVEKKEGQLDAVVEQNGKNFSGGQRQRLTIARALVGDPKILILDDSASALDFATDAALRHAIRDLEGEMTVCIVSQRTSGIREADLILVLDDGHLAGKGTHEELMKNCGLYQEIYYSQFPEERPAEQSKVRSESGKAGKEALA